MPLTLDVTGRARRDLSAIADYGFQTFGRRQAREYLAGLFRTFDILTTSPRLGRQVSDSGVRLHIHRVHLVFYLPTDDALRVLHVRHGLQEPIEPDLFFKGA